MPKLVGSLFFTAFCDSVARVRCWRVAKADAFMDFQDLEEGTRIALGYLIPLRHPRTGIGSGPAQGRITPG